MTVDQKKLKVFESQEVGVTFDMWQKDCTTKPKVLNVRKPGCRSPDYQMLATCDLCNNINCKSHIFASTLFLIILLVV